MTPREVLMLPMEPSDVVALTVGGYLQMLLRQVWSQKDAFSVKRPFGMSGWEHELYDAVVKGGAVAGATLDINGDVDEIGDADQVIFDAIDAMFPEAWGKAEASRLLVASLRRMADDQDGKELKELAG